MSTGPLVGGIGLLGFARLDASADYLTGVLPAGLVFGLGLAMTVAPLTAAVLEAAIRATRASRRASTTPSRGRRACWRSPPSGRLWRRSCTGSWNGGRPRPFGIRLPVRMCGTPASGR